MVTCLTKVNQKILRVGTFLNYVVAGSHNSSMMNRIMVSVVCAFNRLINVSSLGARTASEVTIFSNYNTSEHCGYDTKLTEMWKNASRDAKTLHCNPNFRSLSLDYQRSFVHGGNYREKAELLDRKYLQWQELVHSLMVQYSLANPLDVFTSEHCLDPLLEFLRGISKEIDLSEEEQAHMKRQIRFSLFHSLFLHGLLLFP